MKILLIGIPVFLAAFWFMEFMAWFTHKYVMHGFGWSLHKDHHEPGYHLFERNDLYGLFFAGVSMFLIVKGAAEFDWRFFAGLGVAGYGVAYFFVHDIFVHQRVKIFTRTDNRYLRALRKAHKVHHKKMGKEDCECFGFLVVPRKYWIEAKKA